MIRSIACTLLGLAAAVSSLQPVDVELFGSGLMSTPLDELNAAFSPDGREVYWTVKTNGAGTIKFSQLRGGRWSTPEVAPFSGYYRDYDPFVTLDGRRLYFISNRPKGAATWNQSDYDIYVVERQGNGWSEPANLGAPVNSDASELYPTLARNGTLYFSTRRPGSHGLDIFKSRLGANGRYGEPEDLGEAVNGTADSADYDPWISPDEDLLVFASERPGGMGDADLYVSFNQHGQWTPARHLPAAINSPAREYTPIGSPDHRWLYFTSTRAGHGDINRVPYSALQVLKP